MPHHAARVTPPGKAGVWLPWVHVAIGNLKAFLLGTYHGVSAKYLQEYLDEFCYRFNRREWEAELPLRLLNACLTHTQVKLKTVQRHIVLWAWPHKDKFTQYRADPARISCCVLWFSGRAA